MESMDPNLFELLKIFGGVTLGCFLGLLSSLVVESYRDRKAQLQRKRGIAVELSELCNRLLALVFHSDLNFGRLDRKSLEWMLPLAERYDGPNPDYVVRAARNILALSDANLTAGLEKY